MVSTNRNIRLYVGEMDSTELAQCLLDQDTRDIAQLTVKDIEETAQLIETLMGPSVPPRRAWLLKHAEEANEL